MTAFAPPRVVSPGRGPLRSVSVDLGEVRHGLVDPAGGSRDLDAVLEAARAAEDAGAAEVTVPAPGPSRAAAEHWPSTAQALAVLLATTRVRVVVPVYPAAWDVDVLARFARSATRLAGDRLAVRVLGSEAERFADALATRWPGTC